MDSAGLWAVHLFFGSAPLVATHLPPGLQLFPRRRHDTEPGRPDRFGYCRRTPAGLDGLSSRISDTTPSSPSFTSYPRTPGMSIELRAVAMLVCRVDRSVLAPVFPGKTASGSLGPCAERARRLGLAAHHQLCRIDGLSHQRTSGYCGQTCISSKENIMWHGIDV